MPWWRKGPQWERSHEEVTPAVDRETAERVLREVLADDDEVAHLSDTLRKRERENHLGPMIMRALRGEGA